MRKNKALIPQYFDFNFVYKFLSNKKFLLVTSGKAERPRILSCQIFHLFYCRKSKYVLNPTDMAKVQIKSERLTPFGGIFSIMEQFDSVP